MNIFKKMTTASQALIATILLVGSFFLLGINGKGHEGNIGPKLVGKPAFLPLKITFNKDIKGITSDRIQKFRREFYWENNSTMFEDSLDGVSFFKENLSVMYVMFAYPARTDAAETRIYRYVLSDLGVGYDKLFKSGDLVESLPMDSKGFYIKADMLDEELATAIWVAVVLANGRELTSLPIRLPSLKEIGLKVQKTRPVYEHAEVSHDSL